MSMMWRPEGRRPMAGRGACNPPRSTRELREALIPVLWRAAIAWTCCMTAAHAQVTRQDLYVTNGPVYATAISGNTLYVGGRFTHVGPATGGGVPLDVTTGAPVGGYPRVTGKVYAVVSDGLGGWFIGGDFNAVNGVARSNVAHILPDNSVADWDPNANLDVLTLAVSGSIVYAGGDFTTIGGQTRNHIAALDATTGLATAWDPNASSRVYCLAVNGSVVYAGGEFFFIGGVGGQARTHIAAIDAATGLATSWNPVSQGSVHALAVGGPVVYAGGSFNTIGGQSRNRIAALDASTGLATAWNPSANNDVYALAVNGSVVYAGGAFQGIGGNNLAVGIAALDATTGVATTWKPNPDRPVRALAVNGATVYAAGDFTSIGGQTRRSIAALDASSGLASALNAGIGDGSVLAVATNGPMVYAGGDFNTIGGQTRNNLAALDLTTGAVTAWDPGDPNGNSVATLVVSGSVVYVGGAFEFIGGAGRRNIAALDANTGLATSWNPDADFTVSDVALGGSVVYIAGGFLNAGGQVRHHIAALDIATGLATNWDPDAQLDVSALTVSGSVVYACGLFNHIGGQSREGIAALDVTTGLATPFGAGLLANHPVSLAVSGSTVYEGGDFLVGPLGVHKGVRALDATTGVPTGFDAGIDGSVKTLAVSGNTLYVGGGFDQVEGQARGGLVALDATTGKLAAAWNPDVRFPSNFFAVYSLVLEGTTVYAGGDFRSITGQPQKNLAGLGDLSTPTQVSLVSAEATSDRVRLEWYGANTGSREATVYRRTLAKDWSALAHVSADGTGKIVYEDRDVAPGGSYDYRLGIFEGGRERFLGETSVIVPLGPELALSGLRPNPGQGDATISFSLPDAAPAQLELLDIAGRIVVTRDVGGLGRGNHTLNLAVGRTLAPGVYLLRLTQSKHSIRARAVITR